MTARGRNLTPSRSFCLSGSGWRTEGWKPAGQLGRCPRWPSPAVPETPWSDGERRGARISSPVTCRLAGWSGLSRAKRERSQTRNAVMASKARHLRRSSASSRRRSAIRVPTFSAWKTLRSSSAAPRGRCRGRTGPRWSAASSAAGCSSASVSSMPAAPGDGGVLLKGRDGDHANPWFPLPVLRGEQVLRKVSFAVRPHRRFKPPQAGTSIFRPPIGSVSTSSHCGETSVFVNRAEAPGSPVARGVAVPLGPASEHRKVPVSRCARALKSRFSGPIRTSESRGKSKAIQDRDRLGKLRFHIPLGADIAGPAVRGSDRDGAGRIPQYSHAFGRARGLRPARCRLSQRSNFRQRLLALARWRGMARCSEDRYVFAPSPKAPRLRPRPLPPAAASPGWPGPALPPRSAPHARTVPGSRPRGRGPSPRGCPGRRARCCARSRPSARRALSLSSA